MKHLIKLDDYSIEDMNNIFKIADEMKQGKHKNEFVGKTVVLFFPASSIRTRVTFEKGIFLLGGQVVLFPSDTLDKKERIQDVVGYLNNWADLIVIRHNNISLLSQFVSHSTVPIINAMTKVNHPCEVLSDLYSISLKRKNFLDLQYTFVGINGNIGMAWEEASKAFGFNFVQCCPKGYEIENATIEYDIENAIKRSDIVLTDSISDYKDEFKPYQITAKLMRMAQPGAILNPCPPFYCGEEVNEDAINSEFFVGYNFKASLLFVQQAILFYSSVDCFPQLYPQI